MNPRLFAASILIASASIGFSSSAIAQTQPSSPTASEASASEQQSLKKPFMISPSGTIELPKGTTTVLKALISEPPEGLHNSTEGVSLNGYTGYVPYEGKNLMVTVIDTVSKGDNQVIIPRRIEAQGYRDKTVLSQQDEIKLEVDPADLDAALDELANMDKQNAEAEEQGDKEQKPQTAASSPSSTGSSTGAGTTGNNLAGSYQNPTQEDFTDAKSEVKTTTDGCEVRVDLSQNVAIQQNKTQTFEDGKLKSESECTDSEIRYPLQSSFDGCSDIVDVNALTAYRQSKTYYNKSGGRVTVSSCAKDTSATYTILENSDGCAPVIDKTARQVTVYAKLVYTGSTNSEINVRGCAPSTTQSAYPMQQSFESCTHKVDLPNGFAYARYKDFYINNLATRTEVSDCTVDTTKKWAITEHEGSCKVYVDFTKDDEKVFKQSVMKFTDDKGVLNEARGCDKSTLTEPVAMVQDTNLCSIRHDYDKKQSHEMFIWKYTLDNVAYQASACADTEVVYPHKNYTLDAAGAKVCSAMVDQTAKLVTLFYRTGIVVAENVQYITECKPDSTNKLTVLSTTDSCTDPASWQHDLAASISYENIRWYYTLNGKREYVTPCQKGTKSYMHDQTTVGWQQHDDKLYALPISKVVIDAPIGQYVVSVNTVLDGAVQQPYVLQETKDIIPDSNNTPNSYEGCTGIFNTVKTEIYKRPDSTNFNKGIGAGVAITEAVCVESTVATKDVVVGHKFSGHDCTWTVESGDNLEHKSGYTGSYSEFSVRYNKLQKKNKYNNEVVSNSFVKLSDGFLDAKSMSPNHKNSNGGSCTAAGLSSARSNYSAWFSQYFSKGYATSWDYAVGKTYRHIQDHEVSF